MRNYRNNIILKGNEVRRRETSVARFRRNRTEIGFCSSKGQQQALSLILITGVLIGVVGSVYLWGIPLIQKNRDISLQQNSEAFMKNLAERFKFMANHGGREKFLINVPGNVIFDPAVKTLELTIETQGTFYQTDAWVQLGKNACTLTDGAWGIDEPETLCVRSTKIGDIYTTVYRLTFVQLNTQTLTSYRIDMTGPSSSGGEDHSVIVQNTGTQTVTENNRNIVKTSLTVKVEI